MSDKIWLASVGIGLLALSGCAAVVSPLSGAIYTSVSYPSHGVNDAAAGPKRGEASASSILGIVATGDASIETAARNGRISKIHTVDTQAWSLLSIYATYTTVVTGE